VEGWREASRPSGNDTRFVLALSVGVPPSARETFPDVLQVTNMELVLL